MVIMWTRDQKQMRMKEADDQAMCTVHQVIREQHNNMIPHSDSEAELGAET